MQLTNDKVEASTLNPKAKLFVLTYTTVKDNTTLSKINEENSQLDSCKPILCECYISSGDADLSSISPTGNSTDAHLLSSSSLSESVCDNISVDSTSSSF